MPPSVSMGYNDWDEEEEMMFSKTPYSKKRFSSDFDDFVEDVEIDDDISSVSAMNQQRNPGGYPPQQMQQRQPQQPQGNNFNRQNMQQQNMQQQNMQQQYNRMPVQQTQQKPKPAQQNYANQRAPSNNSPANAGKRKNSFSDDEGDDPWGQNLNGSWNSAQKKKPNTNQKPSGPPPPTFDDDSETSSLEEDDWNSSSGTASTTSSTGNSSTPTNNKNSWNNSKQPVNNTAQKQPPPKNQAPPASNFTQPKQNVHTPKVNSDTEWKPPGNQQYGFQKSFQNNEKQEEEARLILSSLKQVYQLCSAKNLSQETKLKDITAIFGDNETLKKLVAPKPKPKPKDKNNNSGGSGGGSGKVNKKKAAREAEEESETVYKKDTSKMTPEQRKKYLKEQKEEKERLDRERREKLNRELEEEDKKEEEEAKEELKKGRHDIKKIMGDDKLSESTKVADAKERERRARMEAKHKLYEENFTIEKDKKVAMLPLDFDEDTKEVLVEVHEHLWSKMKPHQARGIKFAWDAVFESKKAVEENKYPGGAILAHCMGLGKTLTSIGIIHTVMSKFPEKIRHTLVLTPVNTIKNWVNEFAKWVDGPLVDDIEIFDMTDKKDPIGRAEHLQLWKKEGGVMVMGYEMFRNLCDENSKANSDKTQAKIFAKTLCNPGPEFIVCDEGHVLKNKNSALSMAMSKIKSKRRIILTGTPLQNNLAEYYAMCDFVKPNLLGTFMEFKNRFVNPIQNGQHSDSTDRDVRIMKKRSFILSDLLKGCMQRLDYNILVPYLNDKHEYVLCINLTKFQTELYQYYLDHFAQNKLSKDGTLHTTQKSGGLFFDVQNLKLIWNHPYLLTMKKASKQDSMMVELDSDEERKRKREVDDSDDSDKETDEFGEDLNSWSMKKPKEKKEGETGGDEKKEKSENGEEKESGEKGNAGEKKSSDSSKGDSKSDSKSKEKKEDKEKNPWWHKFIDKSDGADDPKGQLNKIELGSKMVLLMDILSEAEQVGDKVLVFSQSIPSLDLIEIFLSQLDQSRTKKHSVDEDDEDYYMGCWQKGRDYFRMDGSTSVDSRKKWCDVFNEEDNHRTRLFIISTKAGGIGINLVAANRVIIFDASWNPSHDIQSIFRVYRFGQTKPVYIYRFIAQGTMEEKIYDRQVAKQSLSARVVDEQQIERHFSSNDLTELYKFQEEKLENRPTPKVPKDVLLAELLDKHPDMIYKFHDHDSLLENQADENLTEDERKAAWQEFENEKKGIQQLEAGKLGLGQGLLGQGMPTMMGMGGANLNPAVIQAQYRKQYPTWSNEEIIKQTRRYISQRQFEMAKRNAMNRNALGGQGGLNPLSSMAAGMGNRLMPSLGGQLGAANYNPNYGKANLMTGNPLYNRANALNPASRLNPLAAGLPGAAGVNNLMYSSPDEMKQQAAIAQQIAILQNQQQQLQNKALRKQGIKPAGAGLLGQSALVGAGRRPNPYNLTGGPTQAQKDLQARMGKYPTLMEQQRARMQMQRKLMRRKAMQEKGGTEGETQEAISLSSDDEKEDPAKKGEGEEGEGQANIGDTIKKYYEKIGLQKKDGDEAGDKPGVSSSLASTLANLPGLNDSWKTKFLNNYKGAVDAGAAKSAGGKVDEVTLEESEDGAADAEENVAATTESTPADTENAAAADDIADDDDAEGEGEGEAEPDLSNLPLDDTEIASNDTNDIAEPEDDADAAADDPPENSGEAGGDLPLED